MNILLAAFTLLAGQSADTTAHAADRSWMAKCAMPSFAFASGVAFWLFIAWMFGVILYYWWAIRHYNLNWGLSTEEWKILHPETYCKDAEEIVDYQKRRKALEQRTGETFAEPTSNPYEKDSFGLPPGTVRGTLALTALVGFVLVQALSMISPTSLDTHFEQLNTIFKMVMAFYFGSRALEVLEKSRKGDTSAVVGNTDPARNADVAGGQSSTPVPITPAPQPSVSEPPAPPTPTAGVGEPKDVDASPKEGATAPPVSPKAS